MRNLTIAIVTLCLGCSSFKPTLKADEETCAANGVRQALETAGAEIADIVSSSPTWESDLAAKETVVGVGVVVCAVTTLAHDFDLKAAMAATTEAKLKWQLAATRAQVVAQFENPASGGAARSMLEG